MKVSIIILLQILSFQLFAQQELRTLEKEMRTQNAVIIGDILKYHEEGKPLDTLVRKIHIKSDKSLKRFYVSYYDQYDDWRGYAQEYIYFFNEKIKFIESYVFFHVEHGFIDVLKFNIEKDSIESIIWADSLELPKGYAE